MEYSSIPSSEGYEGNTGPGSGSGAILSARSSVSSILENINAYDPEKMARDRDCENDDGLSSGSGPVKRTIKFSNAMRRKLFVLIAATTLLLFVLVPVAIVKAGHASEEHSLSHGSTASPGSGSNSSPEDDYKGSKGSNLEGHSLSLHEMRQGKYLPNRKSISWIDPLQDSDESVGDFLIFEKDGFYLTSWANRDVKTKLFGNTIETDGVKRTIQKFILNNDRSKIIVGTDVKSNWRHSTFAHYWLVDLKTNVITPVYLGHPDAMLSFAEWAPTGDKIAFVFENNLYTRDTTTTTSEDSSSIRQITEDGGKDIFYGRPDWVYEEEVLTADRALWWSPSGDYLAFLRTNDSSVPDFPLTYFVQHGDDGKDAYPDVENIKYPKPGYDNPIVEIWFLDLAKNEYFQVPVEDNAPKDDIITRVSWTDTSQVVIRISSRESDILKVSVVDAKERTGKVVRTLDLRDVDGGWIEVTEETTFIPADPKNGRDHPGYIDNYVVNGYNHLAYFSPVTSSEPKTILTNGKWEVDGGVQSFDAKKNIVYFIATERSPVDRHLYAVNLDGTGFRAITNRDEDGYYTASFSGDSRFALVSYSGPDVPWQKVIDLYSKDPVGEGEVIEDNSALKKALLDYDLPSYKFTQEKVASKNDDGTFDSDIYANTREILPPKFDPSKKYPVLFYVYGGPGSQNVAKTFGVDFSAILASQHDIIVVTVDGRGTGFMGRKFRSVVRDKLGHYEALDQIAAAKIWAAKDYVDETRLAIWGWSYGGFMTLKTLETDAGETFRYGMAVAPPTNWRFYDSIYTERYMHTPQHNPDGYATSSIVNVTNIAQAERFLLMHGTGDDNVHIQNTMVLLDIFDQAGVENYDLHVFPDSNHGISYHNANTIIYDKLESWIVSAFSGKFVDLK